MVRSKILFLIISFLLVTSLNSCGTNPIKQLNEVAVVNENRIAPYFLSKDIDYVYRANITVYGNDLSGIVVIKKINETMHRVVFTTEFGNKLLDFEISETTFKVNAIVDELNRKILVNTLKNDFRILLRKSYKIDKQFEEDKYQIGESKIGNRYDYLYFSKNGGELMRIIHASKRKEKLSISYTVESNIFANKIVIQHQNIKLRIELNYFNNQ
ncbi:hypothetical protein [Flavobacterium muglaense]|uniref:Lipoprotein n=1 Tax=Flavobacterium muglaense TaxID=2764716 RepID=A0A923SEU6_9FLAO|nr:hypothetical protein [Flavobacterium muglaense]MBC5837341.1 hypothetical protein [Flavobacterium muglaense]MBC5843927.1 hypothetical protein [Flavobacterium muglaense]